MKNFQAKASTVFILILISVLFQECKKGAEDPAISLRSRKARLAGSWHMIEGVAGVTILNPKKAAYSLGLVLNGTQASASQTEAGGPPTLYIFPFTLSLDIKKDGTFTMTEANGSTILIASGKWDFLTGVGDAKKKEEVLFVIQNISNDETYGHFFNCESTEFKYKIIELRNESIILECGNKVYLSAGGDNVGYTGTYRFSQN